MDKSKLLEILYEWNIWSGKKLNTGFRREIVERLLKFIDLPEVLVFKGVRRSGKSTLMFQVIYEILNRGVNPKQTLYVNFEEPFFAGETSLNLMEQIYGVYREHLNPDDLAWIFLDEVQTIPGWERWVRGIQEREKGRVKILVTGSSSALLSREFSTLLTGRHVSFEIFPFSFKEFLLTKNIEINDKKDIYGKKRRIKYHLGDYINWGGFPEVTLNQSEEVKKTLLKQYFEDILYHDVVERFRIRDVITLKRLAVNYLTNVGNLMSFRKLGRDLEIPPDTVRKYNGFLEEAYLIGFLPLFSYSYRKQLRNERKVYVIDTGMRNAVGFIFSKDLGRNIENIVYLELRRRGTDIYYWRNDREVDFVIHEKGKKVLLNVSTGMEIKEREKEGLVMGAKALGIQKVLLITEDTERKIKEKGVVMQYTPLYRWLLGY